jgi:hypothetical protein
MAVMTTLLDHVDPVQFNPVLPLFINIFEDSGDLKSPEEIPSFPSSKGGILSA